MKLKFIHAADIHLGSTLHLSNQPPKEYKELFEEAIFNAFKRIVDRAIKEEVDFILLAGDVYDKEERSIKADRFFKQQCHRLNEEGIAVYMIAGNHDPMESCREIFALPENVYNFSSEKVEEKAITDSNDQILAQILGQSYHTKFESQKMYLDFSPSNKDRFNIGLLHTQLGSMNNNYAPASKAELKEKNDIDYWALGHIHQCRIENEFNPVIAYSGIPQGRKFGEIGLGGCLIVEVDYSHNIEYKFIPTSSLVWKRLEIKIDEDQNDIPSNLADLEKLINDRVEELTEQLPIIPESLETTNDDWQDYFSGYILKLVIKGRGEIHKLLQEQKEEAVQYLIKNLQQRNFSSSFLVWVDSIKLRTSASLPDFDTLQQEDDLVFTELSNLLDLCKEKEEWKDKLKDELGEIWTTEVDHEDLDPEKFQLTDKIYNEILEEAKNLIIERIVEGRD
ncbi:metallophosphoesterase family protein [Sporohalobacter salinus]|uniref:metallophosphoesterase family protein n=1 Tax=Sporohalobacter salinus TaxID=1494606 RepID=UPI001961FF50|nr:DNA repair exonuclease [Sporohalobacter salinus]MBM7623794.1 DNA repair exonuclease SbcCD nuclease subunit [Sporohalobacter salinus]